MERPVEGMLSDPSIPPNVGPQGLARAKHLAVLLAFLDSLEVQLHTFSTAAVDFGATGTAR